MVRRLMQDGHECVVYDRKEEAVKHLQGEGAVSVFSLADLVAGLTTPPAVWLMVPAAAVDHVLADLVPFWEVGDTVIDGGNSHYHDDIWRGDQLKRKGIHYLDVGTTGGVAGLERGYCLMIGGDGQTQQQAILSQCAHSCLTCPLISSAPPREVIVWMAATQ